MFLNEDIEEIEFCEVTDQEKDYLLDLLEMSTYEEKSRVQLRVTIHQLQTRQEYEAAKVNLMNNQLATSQRSNMSQKEINQVVAKKVEQDN